MSFKDKLKSLINISGESKGSGGGGLRELDLSNVIYVSLPPSPWKWELCSKKGEDLTRTTDQEADNKGLGHEYVKFNILNKKHCNETEFSVPENGPWKIVDIDVLKKTERPDPGFRDTFPTSDGCLMIHKNGKSEYVPNGKAAIQIRNKMGNMIKERILVHDIYRIEVNPLGTGFAALSSDCRMYIYDGKAELLFEKDLKTVGEKKNYIRCVDVSPKMEKFLYTIIDQAWCILNNGSVSWKLRMPPKEGWRRVKYGTSSEVDDALKYMNLSYPVNPEDIKQRFRELAMKYHPDINKDDPEANNKMINLNEKYELLTGEEAKLAFKGTGAEYYEKEVRTENIDVPGVGNINFKMSMIGPGEDWIYAASFSGSSDYTFIGAYSGKVIKLDDKGEALCVFDVKAPPRQIIDKGRYLYIRTDTRLYILENQLLHKIIDIFEKGNVIVADSGFGLMESKKFTWFSETGEMEGMVITKNPIRLVYSTGDRLVVETRQNRVKIKGASSWWI